VRARVPGILLKRLYKEGTEVKEGQPLFQIDPAPLQSVLAAALAAQAQAQATATNAHVAALRARELVPSGLVSRSDLDNAEALERSSAAAVQQAKANVDSARINLGYARVTAPIAGRAGQQAVTEGALVGQGTPTLLTTVEQLDPIYVNFDQPAVEVGRLRRQQSSGDISLVEPHKAVVQLTLPDGSAYGRSGLLDFSDVAVEPTTGAVALRSPSARSTMHSWYRRRPCYAMPKVLTSSPSAMTARWLKSALRLTRRAARIGSSPTD
jgi:membrane fusion protein (multidrug efflux system)